MSVPSKKHYKSPLQSQYFLIYSHSCERDGALCPQYMPHGTSADKRDTEPTLPKDELMSPHNQDIPILVLTVGAVDYLF